MENTEKKVQALYNSFCFIGDAVFGDKWYTSKVSDTQYKYSKVQFGVKTRDGNVAYVELMGGFSTTKKNVIYSMDKDKNKLEIDFNDRNDKAIIDSVADFKKIRMNFTSSDEKDSAVFISEYDAVEYIKANMQKGQRIVVLGNVTIERYEGKDGKKVTNMKFIPNKIRLAKEEEINKAEVTMSFVFDKDSLEVDRYSTEKKLDIMGYLTTYNKPTKSNVFVPFPLVIDMNHLVSLLNKDMDEAKIDGLSNLYKKYFKADTNEYYETQWKAEVFRGSTVEEITMDDLSEDQKLQIEYGVVTFEQIQKEMGNKGGDKINEIRLVRPTNKFVDDNDVPQVNKLTDYVEDDFYIPEVKIEDKNALFSGDNVKSDVPNLAELFPM